MTFSYRAEKEPGMWTEWLWQAKPECSRSRKKSMRVLVREGTVGIDEARGVAGARHPGPGPPLLLL